jgi:hypothetical protein
MQRYKHLTDRQKEEVLAAYQETLSVAETARRTGADPGRIRHLLKRSGLKPSGEKGGACYRHKGLVTRLAAEGTSLSEIARQVGTTHHRVAAFLRKHGLPRLPFRQTLANNPRWQGGRVIDDDGYVLIKRPDHPHCDRHGYVREHRLVMEATLGRLLLPTEVVHHKDGNRQDNRPGNLELFRTNPEHLARTLAGQTPNWTPDGKARIRAGVLRSAERRRTASRKPSTPGVPPSPGTTAPTPCAPGTGGPPPCGTAPPPAPAPAPSTP